MQNQKPADLKFIATTLVAPPFNIPNMTAIALHDDLSIQELVNLLYMVVHQIDGNFKLDSGSDTGYEKLLGFLSIVMFQYDRYVIRIFNIY